MSALRLAKTSAEAVIADELSGRCREPVRAAAARAREQGQTRWVALVREAAADDPLACYARAANRDRFLWECGDSQDFSVSWGVTDEIESAGPERFHDVRAWTRAIGGRIDWIGDARPLSAATFFGGFGFEPESRGASEWKSFPAARFVLPEAIVERDAGTGRRVVLARVEPGASAESVEAQLRARWARFEGDPRFARGQLRTTGASASPDVIPVARDDWEPGPEYRVRADRSHAIFRAQVERALGAVEQGSLAKVVLARSLEIDHDGSIDVVAFLARLRAIYPTCALIAIGRGEDSFLAATPETLIRVRGGRVDTAALAGSAPRGRTPEEDERLARDLLSDPKERAEHAHVVAAIRAVLEEVCDPFDAPPQPALRRLFGIQHLETPFRGRLASKRRSRAGSPTGSPDEAAVDVLTLVEALHPTPAVCGVPRAEALAWLARHEGLDRGWYAAPIGWLDGEGGGDFRVALRSALIRNGLGELGRSGASRTRLFAGAGIVDGSVPEQELVETRIKLRALLAPLTEI